MLLSTLTHLLFLALLEIPTSILADRLSPYKIALTGLKIKFITTVLFGLTIYFYIKKDYQLSIVFLVLESFLDAISNSLLSGAYQSAYIRKFKALKIETKNIFYKSMKFSIPTRFLIPGTTILLCYTLNLETSNGLSIIVSWILSLRLLVIYVFRMDLKKFSSEQANSTTSLSTYTLNLIKECLSNKSLLITSAFFSMVSSIITMYFLPRIQLLNLLLKMIPKS